MLWYKDVLQFSGAENVSLLSEVYDKFKKNENSRGRDLKVKIDPLFFSFSHYSAIE